MIIFKKEKEVIELILKHVEKVEECLSTVVTTIEAYLLDDLNSAKNLGRQVDSLESEADMIRHDIRDKLYSGAYMPLIREDIYKLVECIDTVANAAEKCCDVFLNQRPAIPKDMKPNFLDAIRKSLGIGESLKNAVLCYIKGECSIEVARHHAMTIGVKESEVDKIEWDLTKKIFISPLEYSHKLHLRRCLESIVEVSDLAEDAADRLELVTLKSMV